MVYKNAPKNPQLKIDWDVVDTLLIKGCSREQVAASIGMRSETLSARTLAEKKCIFSTYAQSKRAKGDAMLSARQFEKALGLNNKGNDRLLIHLGEFRLGQVKGSNVKIEMTNLTDLMLSDNAEQFLQQ